MELFSIEAVNFGPYENFILPLYKQGLVWVGGVNKDSAAADSNGSGKSSIFKALTWCLYGDSIDGEKGDKVIRRGAKKASVTTKLIDPRVDKPWSITRSRSKGAPKLQLFNPVGVEVKGGKEEIQSRITNMVGLDFKAFKNTVLYGQNDSARFAHPRTKDAERKDMLHRIMRTDLLSQCHDHIKEVSKSLRAEVKGDEVEIEKLETKIGEHDISHLEERYDAWGEEQGVQIEFRKGLVVENRNKAKSLLEEADNGVGDAEDLPDLKTIEKTIAQAQEVITVLENADTESEKLLEVSKSIEADYNAKERIWSGLKMEFENLSLQSDRLDGDTCPVCTTPMTDGVAAAHKKSIDKKTKAVRKKVGVVKKELDGLTAKWQKAQRAYEKKSKEAKKLPNAIKEIAKAKTNLGDAKLQIAAAESRADSLRADAKRYVMYARRELKELKAEKDKINPYADQLAEAKRRVGECSTAIKRLDKKLVVKRKELAHYEFWSKGFSNQGLPSFILDSVMPFITERANHYLELLSDGDITMEITTQRELKSAKGELRDEIDINWSIEGADESYPPSGGQLKKMEIAVDLGLMDLVATREGSHLDILMLDEVLDGLDGEGCSRVLMMLQKLRAKRGSIFVISHESVVAEVFEKAIFAVKSDGVAALENS